MKEKDDHWPIDGVGDVDIRPVGEQQLGHLTLTWPHWPVQRAPSIANTIQNHLVSWWAPITDNTKPFSAILEQGPGTKWPGNDISGRKHENMYSLLSHHIGNHYAYSKYLDDSSNLMY